MRPTSVARWGNRTCAAGGRNSKSGFTEAVEKIEGQGTPKLFSGTARRREAITRRLSVQIRPFSRFSQKFVGSAGF